MKYRATYISYLENTLYENDFMIPVIRKAQALMTVNINNRKPTPEIIVWNTETEKPVARIWNDNGEVGTKIM